MVLRKCLRHKANLTKILLEHSGLWGQKLHFYVQNMSRVCIANNKSWHNIKRRCSAAFNQNKSLICLRNLSIDYDACNIIPRWTAPNFSRPQQLQEINTKLDERRFYWFSELIVIIMQLQCSLLLSPHVVLI